MKSELILAIITAIITHGPRAVLVIAEVLKANENVGSEEIEKLFITKKPEDYFK
jgi:hypothetical protein